MCASASEFIWQAVITMMMMMMNYNFIPELETKQQATTTAERQLFVYISNTFICYRFFSMLFLYLGQKEVNWFND